MASIPKIKIYRLDEDYVQSNDNDIQSLSNDEMLPISAKDVNPLSAEQMVGVVERGDARLVVESDWKIKYFDLDTDVYKNNNNKIQTIPVMCQDFVLGKGNFRVFLRRIKKDESSSSSSSSSDGLFDICTQANGWFQIDRNCWDYDIITSKKYFDGTDYKIDNSYENIKSFHNINEIVFKIGQIIFNTDWLFDTTHPYSDCVPIISADPTANAQNRIIVMYKTFKELGKKLSLPQDEEEGEEEKYDKLVDDTSQFSLVELNQIKQSNKIVKDKRVFRDIRSQYSPFRVPFGNIYNGNRNGRCLAYNTKNDDDTLVNNNVQFASFLDENKGQVRYTPCMQFLQGNYCYKRKVMPLRYKIAQAEDVVSNFTEKDAQIDGNSFTFSCNKNWIFDGLMRPVLMQRIKIIINQETGEYKYIFKQLQKDIQYTEILNPDNNTFTCSFLSSYYLMNNTMYSPKEVFLFYNEMDDSLGDIFDFNYDYFKSFKFVREVIEGDPIIIIGESLILQDDDNTIIKPSIDDKVQSVINPWQGTTLGAYGYENRGNLISSPEKLNLLNDNTKIYKKSEILAVQSNYNYDEEKDLKLILGTDLNSVSFKMSLVKYNYVFKFGFRIYINGIKVCDCVNIQNTDSSSPKTLQNTDFIFEFNEDNAQLICTITRKENSSAQLPKDLLLIYYKQYETGFQDYDASNTNRPKLLGYRIPCYEKVKKTNLFVSSFPNWVKGHLNNDLDVFVGNKEYEGTTITDEKVDAIYPHYQDDGWFPSYEYGSIQFSQNKEEFDYFDLFNYGKEFLGGTIKFEQAHWSEVSKRNVLPNYVSNELRTLFSLYYVKVKYNVAYYDGIYTINRGVLSNYSVQNGGSHYALLQDEDFLQSVGKKWLIRNDGYIKSFYQNDNSQLPQIGKADESTQSVSILKSSTVEDGKILKLNTSSDRINVVSFKLSNTIDHNNTMILCLNNSYKGENSQINITDLESSDLRIHVKIDKNDSQSKKTLKIGIEHQDGCIKIGGEGNETCSCNGYIKSDNNNNNNQNYFQMENNIEWKTLQPLEDFYQNKSLNDVQFIQDNENTSLLKRYKYQNESWNYDVYIEVLSYHYNNQKEADGNYGIYMVEYIVYKIDKQ